jgi:hypothetical protein
MPQYVSGSAYYNLKQNTGDWFVGHTIKGPYGEWELTVANHEDRSYPFNGWTWYDTAPSEYVTWYSASFVDE